MLCNVSQYIKFELHMLIVRNGWMIWWCNHPNMDWLNIWKLKRYIIFFSSFFLVALHNISHIIYINIWKLFDIHTFMYMHNLSIQRANVLRSIETANIEKAHACAHTRSFSVLTVFTPTVGQRGGACEGVGEDGGTKTETTYSAAVHTLIWHAPQTAHINLIVFLLQNNI